MSRSLVAALALSAALARGGWAQECVTCGTPACPTAEERRLPSCKRPKEVAAESAAAIRRHLCGEPVQSALREGGSDETLKRLLEETASAIGCARYEVERRLLQHLEARAELRNKVVAQQMEEEERLRMRRRRAHVVEEAAKDARRAVQEAVPARKER